VRTADNLSTFMYRLS